MEQLSNRREQVRAFPFGTLVRLDSGQTGVTCGWSDRECNAVPNSGPVYYVRVITPLSDLITHEAPRDLRPVQGVASR